MARITGQYAKKTFEDDVRILWKKEDEADVWTFDGSTLTYQENNVKELPNPSRWEYAGGNLQANLVNGIPVISGGTIKDVRRLVNEKLDGSGSWILKFSLSNAQIDAVEFYNAFNNVDPTDNVLLWKKMLSGDDTFILSNNPDGNYVRSYAGNDHITGSTGNDIFDGGTGNDTIIGGGGTDIAVFSGRFRDYKITKLTGNSFTAQDTRGIDGTDLLQDISTFRFSDVDKSANDLSNTIGIATFPTAPTDYSYSLSKLSGQTSQNALIGAFENYQFYNLGGNRQGIQKKGTGAIDEITGISTLAFNDTRISVSDNIIGVFSQVTGKETKDAQMFRLYNASFNRFPDSDGLKYWINEYSRGIADYKSIAASFIISNELNNVMVQQIQI